MRGPEQHDDEATVDYDIGNGGDGEPEQEGDHLEGGPHNGVDVEPKITSTISNSPLPAREGYEPKPDARSK